jgi:antitoxin HicB
MSQGDTAAEAIAGVRDAMGAWIADALEEGEPVPVPRKASEHSGRFLVRVPRTLHRDLVREAEREGSSLNQFVTSALAAAVRWRSAEEEVHLLPRRSDYSSLKRFVEKLGSD